MPREISLTRGMVAIVDDQDYDRLSVYSWHASPRQNGRVYAVRTQRNFPTKIYMHREVAEAPPGVEIDHRDGNGLNNQRLNLRPATVGQNQANRRKYRPGTARLKGVSLKKSNHSNPWLAVITVNGQQVHLGYYATQIEAGRAYDTAALELFGEFALLNFPPEVTPSLT